MIAWKEFLFREFDKSPPWCVGLCVWVSVCVCVSLCDCVSVWRWVSVCVCVSFFIRVCVWLSGSVSGVCMSLWLSYVLGSVCPVSTCVYLRYMFLRPLSVLGYVRECVGLCPWMCWCVSVIGLVCVRKCHKFWEMILELSEKFANIVLILLNSCRFWVNPNFFVRLFHPPQFI